MARAINKDKVLAKIPEEFHSVLVDEKDFSLVKSMLNLDLAMLTPLATGMESKYKGILEFLIKSKSPKPKTKKAPGKRTILPYKREDITRASGLMRKEAGTKIVIDGEEVELVSVQVQIKVRVGSKIKSVALSKLPIE